MPDYKKLQEQRESVRIQKEINKLMTQNKNEIQSKEGKEVTLKNNLKIL